jgi:alpha-beta hydrolase superfamily lysophospholipase
MSPDASDPVTDVLGAPYTAETIDFDADEHGPIVTTLVHRPVEVAGSRRKAVLYVHGFNDYFFNHEYAEWWVKHGYDFYALDLRRYGRSMLPHQTPNYVGDIREYFDDLDAAWGRITERDGHDFVVATAHSTGGLTLPLWADEDDDVPYLAGMALNSPWLDLRGTFMMRTAGTALVRTLASRQPMREIPREITSFYGESLHRDYSGEWDYDLQWKTLTSWPVYAGWLSAIREAHATVHAGLAIPCPILVLSSSRTAEITEMNEDVHRADIVLDVGQIRRWSTSLGPHVTSVAIPDAMHDIFLSRAAVRAHAYDELGRWLAAYVDSDLAVAPPVNPVETPPAG